MGLMMEFEVDYDKSCFNVVNGSISDACNMQEGSVVDSWVL
jgi:hypothetical protein